MQRKRTQHMRACERGAEACGEAGDAVGDGGCGEAGAAGLAEAVTSDHPAERLRMRAAKGDATRLQAGAGAARAHGTVRRARPPSLGRALVASADRERVDHVGGHLNAVEASGVIVEPVVAHGGHEEDVVGLGKLVELCRPGVRLDLVVDGQRGAEREIDDAVAARGDELDDAVEDPVQVHVPGLGRRGRRHAEVVDADVRGAELLAVGERPVEQGAGDHRSVCDVVVVCGLRSDVDGFDERCQLGQ